MKRFVEIYIAFFFIALFGCSHVNEVSTYKDLVEARQEGEIQIMTTDTTLYFAERFFFTDSTIYITGMKKKDGVETEFEGLLDFNEIAYIQNYESDLLASLIFIGATGAIVGFGAPNLANGNFIEPTVEYGGGCSDRIY